MNFDKAYVIGSMNFAPKRLNKFYKNAKEVKINAKLWDAINGSEVNLSKYIDKGYLTSDIKVHMAGSLGCLLSHVTLWDYCKTDNDCDIALIFEDDAIIYKNFNETLDSISLQHLPKDWAIIKLGYRGLSGESYSKSIVRPNPIKKKGVNAGNWCYLLNTKNVEKLKEVVLPYSNEISLDVILRNNIKKLNIYFSSKKLSTHNKNYSWRLDLNKPNKSLLLKVKFFLRKHFRS